MAASKPAMSLTDLTIAAARDGLRARDFTARELTEAHLAAIEALNPRLNALRHRHGRTRAGAGGCGRCSYLARASTRR